MFDPDTIFHVCDTETTGLKVEDGDRIVQIACVTGSANLGIIDRYEAKLDTGGRMSSPDSYAVHRIPSDHPDRRPERDVFSEFLQTRRGQPVVFHNGPFDLAFINDALTRLNLPDHEWNIHDTMVMAREKLPGVGLSLDSIARKLGIDSRLIERRKARHDGLWDCELTFEVFRQLAFPTNLELKVAKAAPLTSAAATAPLVKALDW